MIDRIPTLPKGGACHLIERIAEQAVSREERSQMFCYADRAYARSATTMRRGKCLMQVQVAHVRTDKSGIGQTYLGIHVGTVHIYLCAVCMYNLTDFYDFRFKDTMRRG